jgi:hypothetical protein
MGMNEGYNKLSPFMQAALAAEKEMRLGTAVTFYRHSMFSIAGEAMMLVWLIEYCEMTGNSYVQRGLVENYKVPFYSLMLASKRVYESLLNQTYVPSFISGLLFTGRPFERWMLDEFIDWRNTILLDMYHGIERGDFNPLFGKIQRKYASESLGLRLIEQGVISLTKLLESEGRLKPFEEPPSEPAPRPRFSGRHMRWQVQPASSPLLGLKVSVVLKVLGALGEEKPK